MGAEKMAAGGKAETLKVLKALRRKARFVVMPETAFLLYGVKYRYPRKITLILKRRVYLKHFDEAVNTPNGYFLQNDRFGIFLLPPESFDLFPVEILFRFSVKTAAGFLPVPELLMLLAYGEVEPELLLNASKVFEMSLPFLYQLAEETGLESRAKHITNFLNLISPKGTAF